MTIVPGVHRIPLPLPSDGLRAVNAYAIEHPAGVTLIDSGWATPASRATLTASLGHLGYGLEDITDFFVTHVHRDHYSQAAILRAEFGSRVHLGQDEAEGLRLIQRLDDPWVPQFAQLQACGAVSLIALIRAGGTSKVHHEEWTDPDTWLGNHQHIAVGDRSLEVIATPGHTRGHVVFVDRQAGLLFSGDHILPHITPSIGFESAPRELPLASYLASLKLILELPDFRLLPAHGGEQPTTHVRTRELQEHHEERFEKTTLAVTSGARTAFEVAGELGWTRRGRPFSTLDPFNQLLATLETKAHLDVLVTRKALVSSIVDQEVHYIRSAE